MNETQLRSTAQTGAPATASHPGKFVWFEHLSADVPAARRFYEALFGWHTEAMPMGARTYSMIMNGGNAIGGYFSAPAGVPPNWLGYLSVDDVDASHRAALAAGASERMAPTNIGEVGRSSVIADPTGAVLALWKSARGDAPDAAQAAMGAFCWNELTTGDEIKALAFYERVFGYGHDTMDMGPMGSYYILKTGTTGRAGLMRTPAGGPPPMWLPYVAVADVDACAARAATLGAQVMKPPQDIPGVGRFAILLDPLGAAIAVIKLLPAGG